MKILGIEIKRATKKINPNPESNRRNNWVGRGPAYTEYFDGEKTPGELGYLKNLKPDHRALRFRSFEAELKSDIVKIITGKFFKWVVGNGLKLQAEPSIPVLKTERINLTNPEVFKKNTEARFSIYCSSKMSDYRNMDNVHIMSSEAFRSAFLGGDCLCVLRVGKKGNVNMQVVDGEHIQTPFFDEQLMAAIRARGNEIRHGVEISKTGEHIAFYIRVVDKENLFGKFKRVPAKGAKSGKTLAWLIYGDKHRIDHVRGIPVISQILEKIDKLDRYTEATVGAMEERAKIVYSIEHNRDSDGENPLLNKVKIAAGLAPNAAPETSGYELGEKTASVIAATTSKQTFNMPIGAKLTSLDSDTAMEYGAFSKAVFIFICASVDIPPEVALQLYEQNYSSSRAAINGWEYIVKIYREKFAHKFYQNFYNLWLELEIVNNKISAPGFLESLREKNFMAVEAYSKARFTGANMPHIDPLKEVKAVREILGKNDKSPLGSREQASEMLGLGDWEKNMEKYIEETKIVPKEKEDEPTNIQNGQ